MQNKVSVIIPAYNSAKHIEKCITAVLSQTYPALDDIIVVDDGSFDVTAQIIKSFNRVKYIYQNNSGPAAARNNGARNANGEILFFTDSDCVPHADWIKNMVAYFCSHKNIVVSGSYDIANKKSILARTIHHEILFRHLKIMPTNPCVFGSYNFAITKSLFFSVGGFDESFRNPSGEDNDLSYKIISSGAKIIFEKKSLVAHHHPEQILNYLIEQFRHGYWRVKMYLSHPQMVRGDGYTYWKDIIEIPITYMLGFLILSFFSFPVLGPYVIFSFLIFIIFEFSQSWRMMQTMHEKIFFSLVMAMRAFGRTAGFTWGLVHFLPSRLLSRSR